jgi:PKD repeat protein
VVAFVGQLFTLDASLSSDPADSALTYTWDTGNGPMPDSTKTISTVFDHTGPVQVSLTVTNVLGLSDTLTRVVEVRAANEMALFSHKLSYLVNWNLSRAGSDSLALNALLYVGDAKLGADTPVALEIAGQRFTGKLDQKLRDNSNRSMKWKATPAKKSYPTGSVLLSVKLSRANLGAGFAQAGAVASSVPNALITVNIPVHIELDGRIFDVKIKSDFHFHANGTRAMGGGSGP